MLLDFVTKYDAATWTIVQLNTFLQASGFHIVAIVGEQELQHTLEQSLQTSGTQAMLAAIGTFNRQVSASPIPLNELHVCLTDAAFTVHALRTARASVQV
jgi:hypothetical protein